LRGAGVNRLSIGVQSFDNSVLKFLNRAHTADEATKCIEAAHQAGISNLSIDIMFGLPNQHEAILHKDLASAIALQPTHVSVYSLTVEEKTVFGKWAQQGKLNITAEPEAARQFEVVMDTLESNGFTQYEISNYAKPGLSRGITAVTGNAKNTWALGRVRIPTMVIQDNSTSVTTTATCRH
jgi:oxygen-independent coproporphyrinogen-3 oxidase